MSDVFVKRKLDNIAEPWANPCKCRDLDNGETDPSRCPEHRGEASVDNPEGEWKVVE